MFHSQQAIRFGGDEDRDPTWNFFHRGNGATGQIVGSAASWRRFAVSDECF